LTEETLEDGSTRVVLKLPAVIAPTKAAILPLVKKDGLPDIAHKIVDDLKYDFNLIYPFCITIDHDTIQDQKVTIRHRDTMKQERIAISEIAQILRQTTGFKNWISR